MASTSSADPALADPLFAPVRRRHPEVTLVLLPPARPAVREERATTLVEARSLEATTRGSLDDLLDATGLEPSAVSVAWCHQGAGREHRLVARAVLTGLTDPFPTMRTLLEQLAEAGWDAGPHDVPRPRIEARRDPVTVRAEAHPTAVEVEATSDLVVLDERVAAVLAQPEGWS
jgi:hypothetical protein